MIKALPVHASPRDLECFERLADIIAVRHELARRSQFIFLPGPTDPWGTCVAPSPRIPRAFVQRMMERVPGAQFVSNPCRIKYCTQELVLFREDLLHLMQRNVLVAPDERKALSTAHHLASTLLEQAHLLPLPMHIRPVHWAFEHALRLYPQPDLVRFC